MYLAEIHGKLSRNNENKEDILTSNVFSFFKYANREIFLLTFLRELLKLDVSADDAKLAEFLFWPSYSDRTEPDVVIIVGKFYLLFEAKYHSGFGVGSTQQKHQLVREIENGIAEAKNNGKILNFFLITTHNYKSPRIFIGVPQIYQNKCTWINWQSITYLIYKILDNNLIDLGETALFANDLYRLLLKKNLRSFEGVDVLSQTNSVLFHNDMLFFDARTSDYRGDFLGFMPVLGQLGKMVSTSGLVFFSRGRIYFELFMDEKNQILSVTDSIFFKRTNNHE